MREVKIVDTTLRSCYLDKVKINCSKRLKMLKLLTALGVDKVEAGAPALNKKEEKIARMILEKNFETEIRSWNRPLINDLQKSLQCGFETVLISLSACLNRKVQLELNQWSAGVNNSEIFKSYFLNNLGSVLNYAELKNLNVTVEIKNASACNLKYLIKLIKFCQQYGVYNFSYQEEDYVINPLLFSQRIEKIINRTEIELEVNCSNQLFTAAASSLAAWRGGVKNIAAAVNGYSNHRSGTTDLAEIIMILTELKEVELNLQTENLYNLYQGTAEILKEKINLNKSVIGNNIFKHESGIHADGVLKNPETYEPFSPEKVGQKREIVIGKHSGKSALRAKYREFGIEISDELLKFKLEKLRTKAVKLKRALTDKEILDI